MASNRESRQVADRVDEIRSRLVPLGTEERAVHEKGYLKSDLEFLGVKVPLVRKEAKAWLRERRKREDHLFERAELLAVTSELWSRGVHELRSFAIELAIFESNRLGRKDLDWIEQWLREARTWAHVDALAIHLVGRLLARDPSVSKRLDRWSKDPDFWVRRASMLALLLGLRDGVGDWDRFVDYADSMLEEKEFFIRKAIGWILRETSKKRPELVVDYVRFRADLMSPLTLREGIRRLPEDVQLELRGD